jgi:protocatechuate 3,4-dioxygenase beta subunit
MDNPTAFSRRRILRGALSVGAFALFTPGVFADHLERTPAVEEGPFYPYNKLPLDSDNDLIIVGNSTTPAVGQATHLGGRLLDNSGSPIRDALIEIWQCDANAVYLAERPKSGTDGNFQGYGKFTTSSTGEYRFRTIKPVPYPGRPAPHIHVKISKGRQELLTTQIFIRGFAGNLNDGIYRGIRDPIDRELSSAEFTPMKDSKIGEFTARHDLVLGRTPADTDNH